MGESLIREVLHKYLGKDDPLTNGIAKLNKPRLNSTNMYKDLVLKYARVKSVYSDYLMISSSLIHGLSALSYEKDPVKVVLLSDNVKFTRAWIQDQFVHGACG